MTDGNQYAIDKHLAERELYDAAHPAPMFCPVCRETYNPLEWAAWINDKEATCPDCGGELEET